MSHVTNQEIFHNRTRPGATASPASCAAADALCSCGSGKLWQNRGMSTAFLSLPLSGLVLSALPAASAGTLPTALSAPAMAATPIILSAPIAAALPAPMALPATAAQAEWLTDFEAAKRKAAAEHKPILVDFTGSDWCGYCIRMKRDVFDTPEFGAYASEHFVLLEVNLPKDPAFDKEQLKRNHRLCDLFDVSAFPTVLVLSSRGHVAGGFVGGKPDLASLQKALAAGISNAQRLEEAYSLSGEERVRALTALYRSLPARLQSSARGLRNDIIAQDSGGISGLEVELTAEQQMADFRRRVEAAGPDPRRVLTTLNSLLPECLPQNLPKLLDAKFNLQMVTAESVEDLEAARRTLLQVAELRPEYRHEIELFLRERFADPQAMLEQIREQRRLHRSAAPGKP